MSNNNLHPVKRLYRWVNGETPQNESLIEPQEKINTRRDDSADERIDGSKVKNIILFRRWYVGIAIAVTAIFLAIMLYTVSKMPDYGIVDVPTNNEVAEKYIMDGVKDTGAVNIVAGMILDYRAFDTLGESTVLFIAIMSVVLLLRKDKQYVNDHEDIRIAKEQRIHEEHPNKILRTVAFILVPFIFLFGIYVVLNGHISPGGGFSGGAILGAGLIMYANAYGFTQLKRFFNFKVFTAFTSGPLLVYAGLKTYSFFTGANHLHSIIPQGTPGAILSAGLILPLNICVGMIVACTMFGFYSLFSKGEI